MRSGDDGRQLGDDGVVQRTGAADVGTYRLASKEQTMGPRMQLLDAMANPTCIESGSTVREPSAKATSSIAVPVTAVTAATASAVAARQIDTRTCTEGESQLIALDTRPVKSLHLLVR